MAKRKLINKLIHKSNIKEELRLVENSSVDYITPTGKVYCDYGNDMYYPKTIFANKHNGYLYVSIKKSDGCQIQRRVHILVAKAYIPNPNNHPIVMHLDNNKTNCNVSNLKWGTVSENTKQAFDDRLVVNAKGFEDSQSHPVCAFDLTGRLLKIYGSICIAAKELGISKNTISRQSKHLMNTHPRKGYYFRYLDEYENKGFVL